jgi:hypothetical protein
MIQRLVEGCGPQQMGENRQVFAGDRSHSSQGSASLFCRGKRGKRGRRGKGGKRSGSDFGRKAMAGSPVERIYGADLECAAARV